MNSEQSTVSLGLIRSVFLRALGLVFFIAFVSFFMQAQGLIGSQGILPLAPYLERLENSFINPDEIVGFPTLFWFDSSDRAIAMLPQIGIALSACLMIGVIPAFALLGLAVVYLSLLVGGQAFMSFQWDVLLIEIAWIAIPFAGWQLLLSADPKRQPHFASVWLLRLLVFKLMFLSGAVKLMSGDPTWANLTALQYHFETQPLPLATSWFMHHLPHGVLTALTIVMFAVELLVPFLIFFGRTARLIAFLAFAALQIGIFFTGNYGFFNILTLVLSLTLLDDRSLRVLLLQNEYSSNGALRSEQTQGVPWIRGILTWVIALWFLFINSLMFFDLRTSAESLKKVAHISRSLHMSNPYGLFAVMTTERDEIVFEGSNDGINWKEYYFRWRPGAVQNAPKFSAPHMPRLDWLLWFAALSKCEENPWVMRLMDRMLEGNETVLDLIEQNPFEDYPPKMVRAVRYRYKFTSKEERKQTDHWWKRERIDLYCPIFEAQ